LVENKDQTVADLKEKARIMRCHIVKMFKVAGHGHFGGAMSCTDIVAALYFGGILRVDPEKPGWPDRDRLVISKGHGAPAAYAALVERGFCPAEWIQEYESLGAHFSTHPNMHNIPGIDMSTGSLGHGLSIGVGMALAAKMDRRDYRVYVLLGDGELNEGMVWEAAMAASKYHLNHLVAIVDRNSLCVGGRTEDVMPLEPLADKWRAFGWQVHAVDGHDIAAILTTLEAARKASGQPVVIIAETIKGCGVSFMAGKREWHGHPICDEEFQQAMVELGGACECTE
jgi:transketolase